MVKTFRSPGARYFEIPTWVPRRTIARILQRTDGVSHVRFRGGTLLSSDDVRLDSKLRGRRYLVWEPYGDNSRYWIGPDDEEEGSGGIVELEEAFRHHQSTLHRALRSVARAITSFLRKD